MSKQPRRAAVGAGSTACCCWTSRSGCRRTPRCSARNGSIARKRRGTPARSTRSPRDCFRSASAKQPSSRRPCSMRTRPTSRRVRFGVRRRRATPRARSLATRPVDDLAATTSRPSLPHFIGRIEQVPPRHAALKHEGRKYYEYARDGIEIPRAARAVEIRELRLLSLALAGPELRVPAARARTFGCSPRTSAPRSGAERISPRCAGLATGGFALADALDARSARSDVPTPSATPCLLPRRSARRAAPAARPRRR